MKSDLEILEEFDKSFGVRLTVIDRAGLQSRAMTGYIIPDGGTRLYNVRELLGLVQDETTSDERVLEVQREILDKMDSPQKPQLADFVELKPNFMGVGVNLNVVIEWFRRFVGKSGHR